jgi:hypothetical protein
MCSNAVGDAVHSNAYACLHTHAHTSISHTADTLTSHSRITSTRATLDTVLCASTRAHTSTARAKSPVIRRLRAHMYTVYHQQRTQWVHEHAMRASCTHRRTATRRTASSLTSRATRTQCVPPLSLYTHPRARAITQSNSMCHIPHRGDL